MVTPIYAAVLALVFMALSLRIIRLRRRLKIGLGARSSDTPGNRRLLRAMRTHANFAEYTPLSLILSLMLELQGVGDPFVHIVCLFLLAGRLLHAYGVSRSNENLRYRISGMVLTFCSMGLSVLLLIVIAFFGSVEN